MSELTPETIERLKSLLFESPAHDTTWISKDELHGLLATVEERDEERKGWEENAKCLKAELKKAKSQILEWRSAADARLRGYENRGKEIDRLQARVKMLEALLERFSKSLYHQVYGFCELSGWIHAALAEAEK